MVMILCRVDKEDAVNTQVAGGESAREETAEVGKGGVKGERKEMDRCEES